MNAAAEPVFHVHDGRWMPTAHARGPWNPQECHGGAPAALLAREIEHAQPGADMVVTRITYDFLSGVPMEELTAAVEIVKPGRRLQILEARLHAGSREVLRARAMRMRRGAGVDAGPDPADDAAPPPPHDGRPMPQLAGITGEDSFHPTAVEVRLVAGGPGTGAATAWFRMLRPLVPGEAVSGLQRAAAAADFGNGFSHVLPFENWIFVNTDLTIHMHREPVGEWIALDARTDVSGAGIGQSLSILHDAGGRFGAAAQSLFVEPR